PADLNMDVRSIPPASERPESSAYSRPDRSPPCDMSIDPFPTTAPGRHAEPCLLYPEMKSPQATQPPDPCTQPQSPRTPDAPCGFPTRSPDRSKFDRAPIEDAEHPSTLDANMHAPCASHQDPATTAR